MDRRSIRRFIRYSSIGFGTFLIDLLLLWILIDGAGVPTLPATAGAFLLAVSINFFLSRKYVFRGSVRTVRRGYTYFISYAIAGMALTTLLMWLLTEFTDLHYVVVRVLIACIVGIGNYLANLYLNFRVVGVH